MKICRKCGTECQEWHKYCYECGEELIPQTTQVPFKPPDEEDIEPDWNN